MLDKKKAFERVKKELPGVIEKFREVYGREMEADDIPDCFGRYDGLDKECRGCAVDIVCSSESERAGVKIDVKEEMKEVKKTEKKVKEEKTVGKEVKGVKAEAVKKEKRVKTEAVKEGVKEAETEMVKEAKTEAVKEEGYVEVKGVRFKKGSKSAEVVEKLRGGFVSKEELVKLSGVAVVDDVLWRLRKVKAIEVKIAEDGKKLYKLVG